MRPLLTLVLVISAATLLRAQSGQLSGTVHFSDDDERIATVLVPSIGKATSTAPDATFQLTGLPAGRFKLIVRALGCAPYEEEVTLGEGERRELHIVLSPDPLMLSQAVVSGTRNEVGAYSTPVAVHRITAQTFEQTQSLSIAEGLYFSPGLRVENNCQNCGFNQVRMNGLEGAYSQILINSRPIFSALAGVYGLELLPPNMVDRVEVVRGGGSALYGGNAIAGTINIITKDPTENSFDLMYNQAFTALETPDRTFTGNGSVVSEDGKAGATFFGYNRERAPWDANNDGFSEITLLSNTTFGFDAFYKPNEHSRFGVNAYNISEFRRGGSDFDRVAHQARLTEQLEHRIVGAGITFEQFSRNYRHKFSAYASIQTVDRASYYGEGGRVIDGESTFDEDDLVAINAYGQSDDITLVGGLQHTSELSPQITLTSGGELQVNDLDDAMPGYNRAIRQQVSTLGVYSQLEYRPFNGLTLLVGGRFDHLDIRGNYLTAGAPLEQERDLQVLVPRLAAMYDITPLLKLRASYAQGYRGPQAFDEDLHIQTVGGDARFIRLSEDLETERSESYTASLNYTHTTGTTQVNFVMEGFHTRLDNPFILSDQENLQGGVAVITKRNASGAAVQGVNLEANAAFNRRWVFRSGFTLQQGLYDETEIIWEDEDLGEITTATNNLLRMPRTYGYLTATYRAINGFTGTVSSVYTGSMDVTHVIDPDTEFTVIKSTPQFFEMNLRLAYALPTKSNARPEIFAGVQNAFNSFQRDFDLGPERDAGYVYGPMRPRTIFFGFRFSY